MKTPLFKPDKKGMPTLMVFFHPLRCAKNLPITGAVYSYRYQNRDIANLAAPTAFEIDPVNVNIGIFTAERTIASCLDVIVRLLVQVTDRSG